jgi:hypothetical protein
MKSLLIFLCAVPIVASILVANLFGFRRLYKAGELSVNLETILEKLSSRYSKLKYEYKKRAWVGMPLNRDGVALIDEKYRFSKSSAEISRQLISLGLSGIWEDHKKLICWRMKCIKLGYILPPFAFLGCALGMVTLRVPAMWSLMIIGIALTSCILLLWFSREVEKEAASQIVSLIEHTRVLPRVSEEESLIDAVHAWTWVSILPGIAISFMMRKPPQKAGE